MILSKLRKYASVRHNLIIIIAIMHIGLSNSLAEEIKVSKISRISHPAYRMSNLWYGVRNPWNIDKTRIMMWEVTDFTHPTYKETGRGSVWGYISNLIYASSGTVDEYKAAAKALTGISGYGYWWDWSPYSEWSVFSGESSIVYALHYPSKQVKKIDVDKMTISSIVSFDPGDGTDVTRARILGWTTDNTLVVNFDGENWSSGGYEINLQNKTRFRYIAQPNDCSSEGWRWPDRGHGHDGRSPDKLFRAEYGAGDGSEGVGDRNYLVSDCDSYYKPSNIDWQVSGRFPLSYVSWKSSKDWFIGSDVASQTVVQKTSPFIGTYKIYKVDYNRETRNFTYNELISMRGAGIWWSSNMNDFYNYHATPHPTLSLDGTQIMFQGMDGEYYSYTDYLYYGKTPWMTEGVFLAELFPSVSAQSCTSFTYSAWSECQPNNTQTRTVTSSSPGGCTAGNPVLTQSCSYNSSASYTIYKTTMSPTIDGNLFEYASVNEFNFSPSTGGNTVQVKVSWNTEALIIGITVTDSQLNASVTSIDGSIWNEDSIEWFIDTLNNGGSNDLNIAYMLPDDYHGIINILNTQYDSRGTVSGLPSSTWNGSWQSYVKINGTINNNADTDSGYTIEIKAPWTSLGYTSAPSDNTTVRFSVAINDKDDSGKTSLMWPNITAAAENASNWQHVILSGSLATADSTPPAPPIALMIQ